MVPIGMTVRITLGQTELDGTRAQYNGRGWMGGFGQFNVYDNVTHNKLAGLNYSAVAHRKIYHDLNSLHHIQRTTPLSSLLICPDSITTTTTTYHILLTHKLPARLCVGVPL